MYTQIAILSQSHLRAPFAEHAHELIVAPARRDAPHSRAVGFGVDTLVYDTRIIVQTPGQRHVEADLIYDGK